MLKANHSYLVTNSVATANTIIEDEKLGKPSRVIFEFKPNDPTVQNCGFSLEQFYTEANLQSSIFVKQQTTPLNKGNKWPHGAIYVCSYCGAETDMTGKP